MNYFNDCLVCVCVYICTSQFIYCFLLCLGPPGTGKTFVGIELMKVLLSPENRRNGRFGPILTVCFTNHALDQFLEVCNFLCSHPKACIFIIIIIIIIIIINFYLVIS